MDKGYGFHCIFPSASDLLFLPSLNLLDALNIQQRELKDVLLKIIFLSNCKDLDIRPVKEYRKVFKQGHSSKLKLSSNSNLAFWHKRICSNLDTTINDQRKQEKSWLSILQNKQEDLLSFIDMAYLIANLASPDMNRINSGQYEPFSSMHLRLENYLQRFLAAEWEIRPFSGAAAVKLATTWPKIFAWGTQKLGFDIEQDQKELFPGFVACNLVERKIVIVFCGTRSGAGWGKKKQLMIFMTFLC